MIGWLGAFSRDTAAPRFAAFKEGMAALGWKEGSDYIIEDRWMESGYEQLQSLAQDLANKKPAVIVAAPSQAVAAAAKAAPNIPIVAAGGNPAAVGMVSNLARPGGMITGVSNVANEIFRKRLELMLDAVGKARAIGIVVDPQAMSTKAVERLRHAMAQRPVELRIAWAARTEDVEPAMFALAKAGAQALVAGSSPLFSSERQRIVKLASAHQLPIAGGNSEWAEAGALFAFGADALALWRRAAYYVDRILKGAKPGDLPIEQPMTFELVVNPKTAKALGLTMRPEIMARATRLIE